MVNKSIYDFQHGDDRDNVYNLLTSYDGVRTAADTAEEQSGKTCRCNTCRCNTCRCNTCRCNTCRTLLLEQAYFSCTVKLQPSDVRSRLIKTGIH